MLEIHWVRVTVPVLAKYVYPTALFVHTLSIYITVLVAVQRYACLCRPYRASLSCQRQHVRRYIAAVTVFAILFTLPRYFEYDFVQSRALSTTAQNDTAAAVTTTTYEVLLTSSSEIAQTHFSKNHIYRIVYFNLRSIKSAHVEADRASTVK